jgi:hypothetical protein
MPRKSAITQETDEVRSEVSMMTTTSSTDEKLDQILLCLQRMDARDRWRQIGGFIRGVLTLVPIFIFLVSAWYFYQHGPEVLKQLTDMTVKSAASFSQQGLEDQFNSYIGKPAANQ